MILLDLFWTFFKIGLFTFGGGYAMLPLIQAEVESHGWIAAEELLNFVAVSESTPGPFAVNMATYIGTIKAGMLGGACATLGVVLPSFVIILIVARLYAKFRENRIVAGCMRGLKSAVVGLIASAMVTMAATVLFPNGLSLATFATPEFWFSAVLFIAMSVLAFKKVHPILLICISAALGIAAGYLLPVTV